MGVSAGNPIIQLMVPSPEGGAETEKGNDSKRPFEGYLQQQRPFESADSSPDVIGIADSLVAFNGLVNARPLTWYQIFSHAVRFQLYGTTYIITY